MVLSLLTDLGHSFERHQEEEFSDATRKLHMFLTFRKGFEDMGNTWEPVRHMYEYVPEAVRHYLAEKAAILNQSLAQKSESWGRCCGLK